MKIFFGKTLKMGKERKVNDAKAVTNFLPLLFSQGSNSMTNLFSFHFQLQKEEQRKIDEAYDLNEDEQEEKEDLLTQGKFIFFCKITKKFVKQKLNSSLIPRNFYSTSRNL